jgi:peptide/nickel transport system ATP-binding protein
LRTRKATSPALVNLQALLKRLSKICRSRMGSTPQHPYTIGLLGSIPRLDWSVDELAAIDGMVPNMAALPRGCRFAPRCPFVREICTHASPPIVPVGSGHASRCVRAPLEQVLS